ncbi:MAG: sugar ABC transporter ATP-binding protein [Planctomycetaceae bacterium]|nr:sugar ABC transporter ATP-binding protein [Planctomycetaceae bacterium]
MNAQTPALEVVSISKRFPGSQALDRVSLAIRRGEIRALVGENGAGKSTLMNIVMGLLHPDTGTILRHGRAVDIPDPLAAQALRLGMVPQELNLVPNLTVAENINLGALPGSRLRVDWPAAHRRAADILRRIGGNIDSRQRVAALSMAQRQLVQISRALVFGAEIMIFDEPTASLTHAETERLFGLIRDFRAAGGSVFYISHRLEEIRDLTDTITVLRDGRKVADLETASTSIATIISHMAGREVESAHRQTAGPAGRPVVRVENLTRNGEFEDVSFTLHEGEILGFAGLVGAGRTELMRCLCGDSRPDDGRVMVGLDGGLEAVSFSHPADAIRAGISYVPEERRNLGIFPQLGVMENMAMPALRAFSRLGLTLDRTRLRRAAAGAVRDVGVKTSGLDQCIATLSGGNQQKAIIARWILRPCRVLVLDEPTRGIDVNAKGEIYHLLRSLIRDRGMSVIVVSSELQELLDVADRIVVMHEGRVRGEVIPGSDTTQEDILRHALDGEAVGGSTGERV